MLKQQLQQQQQQQQQQQPQQRNEHLFNKGRFAENNFLFAAINVWRLIG